jgi:hypothetical protein
MSAEVGRIDPMLDDDRFFTSLVVPTRDDRTTVAVTAEWADGGVDRPAGPQTLAKKPYRQARRWWCRCTRRYPSSRQRTSRQAGRVRRARKVVRTKTVSSSITTSNGVTRRMRRCSRGEHIVATGGVPGYSRLLGGAAVACPLVCSTTSHTAVAHRRRACRSRHRLCARWFDSAAASRSNPAAPNASSTVPHRWIHRRKMVRTRQLRSHLARSATSSRDRRDHLMAALTRVSR